MSILSNILPWLQVIFAVLLVAAILIQQNEASLGSAFGGGGAGGGVAHTKRGLERTIFVATIILAILFTLTSLLNLFI